MLLMIVIKVTESGVFDQENARQRTAGIAGRGGPESAE